jgi:hypothetical protein
MSPEERIQVASADNVLEFQDQLNYLYAHGYHLLSQSTASLGDRIIFTAVLEKVPILDHEALEETLSLVEQEHEDDE